MRNPNDTPGDLRFNLLSMLGTSGTLAGFGATLAGFMNLRDSGQRVATMVDDLFLFAALGFLLNCYLIFFTLRFLHTNKLYVWVNLVDAAFLLSLTLLVVAGFLAVYTVV